TIGESELTFRVRNGTGRFHNAMTAVTRRDHQPTNTTPHQENSVPGLFLQNHTVDANTPANNNVLLSHQPLVPVSSTHYCASTSGLSTQSSPGGLSHHKGAWISHLEAGFPLRCFQRLDRKSTRLNS